MSRRHARTGARRVMRWAPVVVVALGLLLGGGYAASVALRDEPAPAPTTAPTPTSTPETCTVDALLVNSCRPWFGGTSNHYPEARRWDKREQILAFERRLGRRLDVVHSYHVAGDNELSDADVLFAKRPRTLLFTNWQPTKEWRTPAP